MVVAVAGVVEGDGVVADGDERWGCCRSLGAEVAGEGAERLAGGGEGDGAGGCGGDVAEGDGCGEGWP